MEKVFSFFLLLLLLKLNFLEAHMTRNISTDQSALLSLKSSFSLNSSNPLTGNWSSQASVCDWMGVTCGTRHHRVIALNVSDMNIYGSIPPQLGNLSFLNFLDLSGNNLQGNLPRDLARLRRLRVINLGHNNFNEDIPVWFNSFSELQVLILDNNSFTGISSASISNLSKLEILIVRYNNLQGSIPKEIGNLRSLWDLRLGHNKLSGPIPSSIFNLSMLELLDLNSNQLSGKLPTGLANCTRLLRLSFAYNNFCGTIPSEILTIERLQILYLGGNNLQGAIPESIDNLQNLQQLSVENNHIVGLPHTIGNISSLSYISLKVNSLSEYGSTGLVSTKCDVYSYGIMLMETFTGKRPNEEMFQENLTLRSWIYNSLSAAPEHIVDATLLESGEFDFDAKLHSTSSILQLALNCTSDSPKERLNMNNILADIKKIKLELLQSRAKFGQR